MTFTPLHDRVLVRRIDGDAKTSGGLFIPDTAKEKPQEGEIVAVGAGGLLAACGTEDDAAVATEREPEDEHERGGQDCETQLERLTHLASLAYP